MSFDCLAKMQGCFRRIFPAGNHAYQSETFLVLTKKINKNPDVNNPVNNPRNLQSFPVDIWSPVVSSVSVNFDNPINSHSAYQDKLSISVHYDNQPDDSG